MIATIKTYVRRAARWVGLAIGSALLAIECLDAWVTPRPDWLWFGLAVLLIALCWTIKPTNSPRG